MTLLSDARQGRKGGVLPWGLLIIGSAASLAANVAVADPRVWSRMRWSLTATKSPSRISASSPGPRTHAARARSSRNLSP